MPRHTFDPTAVSSTLEVFPKGDYLISIGEPKAFQGTTKSGKNEGNANWGIRWGCKIERVLEGDPNAAGKRLIYTGYLNSEEAAGFPKQFVMAALGYPINAKGEREFNEAMQGQDWDYDPESGACGDVWRQTTGKTLITSLDVQPDEQRPGEFRQKIVRFRPVAA